MNAQEQRAVLSLASIMGLRMLGLFMVLPMFSLYATQLRGATPALIGIAMGVYGLCQAIFQIPFGSLSDKVGRRPVIMIGLFIFILGSAIAGLAHTIGLMIVGRALQGAGAIGGTVLAMLSDLTRESQRTKSMAIAGITIGFSFTLAMFLGPMLTQWMPIQDLFFVAALCGFGAIFILYVHVPIPTQLRWHGDTEPELKSFLHLLSAPTLLKLNSGILFLHAIFTASFIVIPISLLHSAGLQANQQWMIYLPALLVASVTALFCVSLAERKRRLRPFFLGGIIALALSEILLWAYPSSLLVASLGLCAFFTGFSLLEAFLPSLVSRAAPAARKGSALGLFSCSQFLGIFIGGALGGWLYGKYHYIGVYLFCLILALCWLMLSFFTKSYPDIIPTKDPLQSE